MANRTAQDMQDHGVERLEQAIAFNPGMHVVEVFAFESLRPPPGQLMVHIDGYDYLITIEFQDPR